MNVTGSSSGLGYGAPYHDLKSILLSLKNIKLEFSETAQASRC